LKKGKGGNESKAGGKRGGEAKDGGGVRNDAKVDPDGKIKKTRKS